MSKKVDKPQKLTQVLHFFLLNFFVHFSWWWGLMVIKELYFLYKLPYLGIVYYFIHQIIFEFFLFGIWFPCHNSYSMQNGLYLGPKILGHT